MPLYMANDLYPPLPPEHKETNPKDALANGRVNFGVLSVPVLSQMALGMMEGGFKYGTHNFRVAGVSASVYYSSTVLGHLGPWWEGQEIDPDSGLNHIFKAMSSLHVLADAIIQGKLIDDRPVRTVNPNFRQVDNVQAKSMAAKYPKPVPGFTQLRLDAQVMTPSNWPIQALNLDLAWQLRLMNLRADSDARGIDIYWQDAHQQDKEFVKEKFRRTGEAVKEAAHRPLFTEEPQQ